MKLKIKILQKRPINTEGLLQIRGQLMIGEHKEFFLADLDWWPIEEYKKQWREGLERIKTHDQSCLIVSIGNPIDNRFIEWWLLYKRRNKVYLQNHIIFGDTYADRIGDKEFNRDTCYDFIPKRRIKSSEKNVEWSVRLSVKNDKIQKLTIKTIDKKLTDTERLLYIHGELRIDKHRENFLMPLDWWSIEEYKKQWQEGLERIKTHDQSCLISRITNPAESRFIEWYLLYKIKNKIYLQHHIIFGYAYEKRIGDKEFNSETCYDFIPKRKKRSSEHRISEWSVAYP